MPEEYQKFVEIIDPIIYAFAHLKTLDNKLELNYYTFIDKNSHQVKPQYQIFDKLKYFVIKSMQYRNFIKNQNPFIVAENKTAKLYPIQGELFWWERKDPQLTVESLTQLYHSSDNQQALLVYLASTQEIEQVGEYRESLFKKEPCQFITYDNKYVLASTLELTRAQKVTNYLLTKGKNGYILVNFNNLIDIVRRGNLTQVKRWITYAKEFGFVETGLLYKQSSDSDTPLLAAITYGYTEIVEILLITAKEEKIEDSCLQQQGKNHDTPLIVAALKNNVKIVNLLLAIADKKKITKSILQQKNEQGFTALHRSGWNGHIKIIKTIIEYAKKEEILEDLLLSSNNNGYTTLLLASLNGHKETVEELFHFAKNKKIIKDVFRVSNFKNINLLMAAISGKNTSIVELLLCFINEKNH